MKSSCICALVAVLLLSTNAVADNSQENLDTAAKEWRAYVEPIAAIGERVAPLIADAADAQQRQEMHQQLFKTLSMAYMALFLGDARHPDFWPIFNQAYSIGSANPDDSYYLAPLEGNGVYKISGYRGSVRLVDFQIGSGQFYPRGQGGLAPTLANYDIDDLHVRKDGYFEVVLSTERPKDYQGDWWKLDPRAAYVMMRQIAYDWKKEVDGRFAIERLDTPAIRPRPSAEQIAANLKQIAVAAETWTALPIGRLKSYAKDGLVNKVVVRDLSSQGGFTQKQLYVEGLVDIADDEALVYETEVPKKCRYWNIATNDSLWNAIDPANRQTSINGFQARIDKDGKFRAVISAQDPGVPNWLDTAGFKPGSIFGRWLQCDSNPTASIVKVKLTDVRKHLPADTPTVTAAQRDASIRARRQAAQLRRRW